MFAISNFKKKINRMWAKKKKLTFVPVDLPYRLQPSARSLPDEISSSIYPRVDVYPLVHSGQKTI